MRRAANLSQIWETCAKSLTRLSIKKLFRGPALRQRSSPIDRKRVYCVVVPRTDENGRQLKALLDYLLDGDIDAKAIYTALGVSSSTYYRRIKEPDYPNAEELRQVADRFNLSYPDLQVRFGLMSRQEVWHYVESSQVMVAPVETATRVSRPKKLSELSPRPDAPPL
ncbi:hypothetical protein MSMEI_3083 [Mycolicibacterium smegmatis MC2 155]|uniref:HTH cro/C1-type domain-containing protein n=1 Tax=Mycolicibacterium smegmatis (strain ATCC 700084 / mc(2)155) TaxID=246196 RepID=I7G1C9_MYCS2|nr:hypothetical protein MSMEI_3083 [Mycolicibacterium smegmatis MC2 155]